MKTKAGKNQAWYAITRIESPQNPGYMVAVKRQGLQVSKQFSVSRYGNDNKATLNAARQWRDRVLALLPPMTSRQLRTLVRRNNTTGIPGIQRVVKEGARAYWVAVCEVERKRTFKYFSIREHGEDGARQLAIEARQQMLQSVHSQLWLATPAARNLSARFFAPPTTQEDNTSLVWDSATKERFLAQLRAEGLIGKAPTPAVNRRHYASQAGPVWEASHIAPDGKKRIRRFSINKHGEEAAKHLAEQAYAQLVAEYSTLGQTVPDVHKNIKASEKR